MERELLLLGLLRQARMYGYQLHEFIERDLATCTDLKKPTAYFLLEKMARRGWISQAEERDGNRPPRRVYQITAEGEQQFQRLLRDNLGGYSMTRFAGDVGLAFADALPPHEVLVLLHQRHTALLADLAAARAVPQHEGSIQLVVEHRIVHLEAELHWLDDVMARIAAAARKSAQSNTNVERSDPYD
ncbi:MAG TPA: PadR family transcriptional regulator [Roseiflexaceae bacterium]|jgi:DNA-binding PadR family transcriptional regulator|nr:PadR family transcriptional regulator [Roseiflexaceae bacterium]